MTWVPQTLSAPTPTSAARALPALSAHARPGHVTRCRGDGGSRGKKMAAPAASPQPGRLPAPRSPPAAPPALSRPVPLLPSRGPGAAGSPVPVRAVWGGEAAGPAWACGVGVFAFPRVGRRKRVVPLLTAGSVLPCDLRQLP